MLASIIQSLSSALGDVMEGFIGEVGRRQIKGKILLRAGKRGIGFLGGRAR